MIERIEIMVVLFVFISTFLFVTLWSAYKWGRMRTKRTKKGKHKDTFLNITSFYHLDKDCYMSDYKKLRIFILTIEEGENS
jgi:hypothetical protein